MDDFLLVRKFKEYNAIIKSIDLAQPENDFRKIFLTETINFIKNILDIDNVFICEKLNKTIILRNQELKPYYKLNIDNSNQNSIPFTIKRIEIPYLENHKCPLHSEVGKPAVCIPFSRQSDGSELWLQIHLKNNDLTDRELIFISHISFHIDQFMNYYTSNIMKLKNRLNCLKNEYEQFIHAVSHDIKAPVTAILGFTSLINDENLSGCPESINHYLKRISFNAYLIDQILNNLLYIARLKVTNPEKINLGELVQEVLVPFNMEIKDKKLKINISKNQPTIRAERVHIHKLFQNIIKNSIEHSKEGGMISIEYRDGVFYIIDNGTGINNEFLDKIFSIFFTTSNKKDGHLGIGLFIAKKIVELYGGEIKAQSEPGKGTTIYFTLPKCRVI